MTIRKDHETHDTDGTRETHETHDTVVVGAGLAGLIAARTLAAVGRSCVVLDKGRSVGGRLATRRVGGARLDHGAQFFTVRGDDFAALVSEAESDGIVHIWNRGFEGTGDGYPRWCGSNGMNGIAKYLARDLDVRTGVRVDRVACDGGEWELQSDGATFRAPRLILTPPVPQTLALLDAGEITLPPEIDPVLRAISYHCVLALLCTFDAGSGLAGAGGMQLPNDDVPDSVFSFVGDNRSKGISESLAVTFHANHQFSATHFERTEAEIHPLLLAEASKWFATHLGGAQVVESQVKKWRYAGPVTPHPQRAVRVEIDGAVAVFAGDAFGGPKVEGAFNSGLAAAAVLQ